MLGQIDPALEAALSEQWAAWNVVYADQGGLEAAIAADIAACTARSDLELARPIDWQDRRTHAPLPDTATAQVYADLPKIARYIAGRIAVAVKDIDYRNGYGVDQRDGAQARLAEMIDVAAMNFPYERIAALDWKDALAFALERPIFTWDDSRGLHTFPVEEINLPVPIQKRAPDQWSINPAFAMYFFAPQGNMPFGTYLRYSETFGFVWTDAFAEILFQTIRNFLWGLRAGTEYGRILATGSEFVSGKMNAISRCVDTWIQQVGLLPKAWLDTYAPIGDALREQRRAERLRDALNFIGAASALFGITGALQSIASQGLSITNGANLITSIDRIPGVDLGKAGQVVKLAGRAFDPRSVANTIGLLSLAGVADAEMIASEVTEQLPMDAFESGFYEVTSPDSYWGDFALPDLSSVTDSLVASATDTWGGFSLSSFLTDLAKTYAQYDLQKRAIEAQTGRPAPAPKPAPGTVRTLPDGSVARTNPDGSTTITTPRGEQRTVTPSGQIIAGGAQWIPGIPNIALLIGGGLLLGALFLSQRK